MLQPNYRYAYREYFDDYTHVAVYSHISLADFLVANGWEVIEVQPRFLPLTVKSRLPVSQLADPPLSRVAVQADGQADAAPRAPEPAMSVEHEDRRARARSARRLCGHRRLSLFALVATLCEFGGSLGDGYRAIRFPGELDYGEGIVWEQMRLMVAGRGYGAIDGFRRSCSIIRRSITWSPRRCRGADRARPTGRRPVGVVRIDVADRPVRWSDRGDGGARRRLAPDRARCAGWSRGWRFSASRRSLIWAPLMRVDMLSIALSLRRAAGGDGGA